MDEYQRACERKARQYAELRAEEEELQELQAQLAQRQRSGEELVYKTFETPAQQPRQEDQWAAWNAWADNRIEKFLAENPFTENQREALGYGIAHLRRYTRKHVKKELAKLHVEKELAELRTEIEILRSVVKAGNVEQLVRNTNVA